ncbi:MAG TPA: hypothetical protein VK337_22385 [Xanthobacteraceae bacterium]|nr:hypothetical protein [Xanthobacteraceae bacterium]
MPRLIAAALFAVVFAGFLALAIAPAQSAETATPDDTARFLAGLPPAPGSPLAALAKDPGWAQHAHFFDSIFTREDANTLAKVRAFSKEHLPQHSDTMLYMFSGPDFLYATSFFPSASTYVLSGLEPVGDVPQLTSLPRGAVDASLHNIEGSLATILNLSFFITKNMKTQLTTGPVYGTLPILYVFLARTGKTVHEVSFVSLDKDGNFIVPDDAGKRAGRATTQSAAKGVKIVFSDGNGPRQTLYYFSTDLSDGGVKISGFLQFCAGLGRADSFLKSASYLLHGGNFNRVRSFLIDHSATILEDDSGIPLGYFDPKTWRLQPFGHYLAPLGIFPNTYQPRMTELFRNAAPLDFGIGYLWRKNESNLLLATRLPPGAGEAEFNPSLTIGSDSPPTVVEGPKPHRKPPPAPPTPRRSDGLRGFFSVFGFDDPAARPRPPK